MIGRNARCGASEKRRNQAAVRAPATWIERNRARGDAECDAEHRGERDGRDEVVAPFGASEAQSDEQFVGTGEVCHNRC
jgi:hypothetical protein